MIDGKDCCLLLGLACCCLVYMWDCAVVLLGLDVSAVVC